MTTNPRGYNQEYYQRNRNRIIQILGGRCCKCFNPDYEDLEIHHIEPCGEGRGRGSLHRLTEWKQAIQATPSRLAVECTCCHPRSAYG